MIFCLWNKKKDLFGTRADNVYMVSFIDFFKVFGYSFSDLFSGQKSEIRNRKNIMPRFVNIASIEQ